MSYIFDHNAQGRIAIKNMTNKTIVDGISEVNLFLDFDFQLFQNTL